MDSTSLMARCLYLAQRAKGFAAPNPMVGALLVHNGAIIAEGWHHAAGQVHAEVDCLNNVPPHLSHLIPDSTMYVNLEPCAHQGRTPPCAPRLVQERIKKVVVGNADPFAEVNGKGIAILESAGITVDVGIAQSEGRWVNRRFFTFHEQQRPYIILKWAQTRDGYMAPANRMRFAISNPTSNMLVHKWRTEEAAIMIGAQTALHDNPQLNARLWEGPQPVRFVIGRNAHRISAPKLREGNQETWFINNEVDGTEGNTHYYRTDFEQDALTAAFRLMHSRKLLSVLVEGGQQLLQSCIAAGLWDEARIITGQGMLGGGIAPPRLTNAEATFQSAMGGDTLSVYTRAGNGFAWPGNQPL